MDALVDLPLTEQIHNEQALELGPLLLRQFGNRSSPCLAVGRTGRGGAGLQTRPAWSSLRW